MASSLTLRAPGRIQSSVDVAADALREAIAKGWIARERIKEFRRRKAGSLARTDSRGDATTRA